MIGYKMRAGTDIVDSCSHFLMIGGQLWLENLYKTAVTMIYTILYTVQRTNLITAYGKKNVLIASLVKYKHAMLTATASFTEHMVITFSKEGEGCAPFRQILHTA
jgi:hypothetical protein